MRMRMISGVGILVVSAGSLFAEPLITTPTGSVSGPFPPQFQSGTSKGLRLNAEVSSEASTETTVPSPITTVYPPQYWADKAKYYKENGDAVREEEALKVGLSLCVSQENTVWQGKGFVDWHSRFVNDYANFLIRQKRGAEAQKFLYDTLEKESPTSLTAERIAVYLGSFHPELIDTEKETLWSWLRSRKPWDNIEKNLLQAIIKTSPKEKKDEVYKRMVNLAVTQDVGRMYVVGCLLTEARQYQRAVAVLRDVPSMEGHPDKRRAMELLMDDYILLGDWKNAEVLYPEVTTSKKDWEKVLYLKRMTFAAERAGDKEAVERFEKQIAKLKEANPNLKVDSIWRITKPNSHVTVILPPDSATRSITRKPQPNTPDTKPEQ